MIISFCFFLGALNVSYSQKAKFYLDSLSSIQIAPADSIIISALEEITVLARDESDDNTLASALTYLGTYYYGLESLLDYERVVSESYRLIKTNPKVDPWIFPSVYNNMALLESTKGKYHLANTHYLEAIELEKRGPNDSTELTSIYSNIASNYTQLGDYNKSLDFFEQAISYCSPFKDNYHLIETGRLYSMAGLSAFHKKDFYLSRKYYDQSQDMLDRQSNEENEVSTILLIDNLQRSVELDLEDLNFDLAEEKLKQLLKIKIKNSYRNFRTIYLEGMFWSLKGEKKWLMKDLKKPLQS